MKKESLLSQWKAKKKAGDVVEKRISKAPEGAVIPLSHSQQRLWFLQQLYPNSPFYNYSESYVFRGELQPENLIKAMELVCNDHDILRSTYHIEDGKTMLRVDPSAEMEVSRHDLSNLDEAEARREAEKIMTADATKSFDLEHPPIVRIALIKIHAEEHILLVSLHHISTDKWSMRVLRDQLAAYYIDLCSGIVPSVQKQDIQYSDYAYWLRNNEVDDKQLGYWKDKLSGEIPLLNMPTDFQRPLQSSFKGGASYTQEFSKELSTNILTLSKKLETTPYVLLLSVYYVLLYRFSGQKDILIGTPITSRDQKVLEDLIGFFNDTVVLRTELSSEMSFTDLVAKVRKTTLEAFSNKDVPFDLLVKELKLERSLAINPFFQVMFLYHAVPTTPSFGKEVSLDHSFYDAGVSKFDLTLYISEEEGMLTSTFEYTSDLFEEKTINRFQEYYRILLEGITKNPDQSISGVPMLTDSEKNLFLDQTSSETKPFSSYTGIHEIIAGISENSPNAQALTYNGISMTYGELDEKASIIATMLLKKIRKPNEVIGLCVERSLDMIVGLVGILKAGCAYLPIDPEYPAQRIDFILEDAQVDIVITQNSLQTIFEEFKAELLFINEIDPSFTSETVEFPKVSSNDLAYIIYTSGSTGRPKGVPISHKNILASTQGRLDFYENNPTAFLLMSSISFDSSKAGIFWTLCTGGNLVISEKRIEQDIARITDIIEAHKISHTLMLPSLYKLILENSATERLSSLNTVMVAGEACSTSLCKIHFGTMPQVALYNEYGPTEATVWCIAHKIEKEDTKGIVPIGKAVSGAQVYLLNPSHELVPYGAVGEIYIGGPGLAGHYMNRPDLTDAAYIDNPFASESGTKLYKTGDLGRYNTRGTIEFLGRADHQVKIRGFRIELSEIEKIILQHQMVQDAVVVVEESSHEEVAFGKSEQLPEPEEFAGILKHLTDKDLTDLFASVESLSDTEKAFMLRQIES